MIELLPQTLDLMEVAIYSAVVVFLAMLLLNGVSDLLHTFFGGEDG
jgi:hypothetical protein